LSIIGFDELLYKQGSGPLANLFGSTWDKVFEVNLRALLFLYQPVYCAWMKDRGDVILNISSAGGYQTIMGINAYNVTKDALIHFMRCLAIEWGYNGIRVTALAR
jgi:NAD(P)-dependent dehydrogenase (short-subunit alcohol dehydrogenase family)